MLSPLRQLSFWEPVYTVTQARRPSSLLLTKGKEMNPQNLAAAIYRTGESAV